jgi:TetR/AcrR family transcriptional repressor of mexJK operon
LLDTALALFVKHGFSDVTLAEVARTAHVALRTIYLNCGGKEGLLRALVAEEGERHRGELAALRLDEKDFSAQLECLSVHLAGRVSRPDLLRLYAIVGVSADKAVADLFEQAGPRQLRDELASVLTHGLGSTRDNTVPGIDMLCDHFIACIAGSRTAPQFSSDEAALRASQGLDLFLRVLASLTPSQNSSATDIAIATSR